MTLTEKIIAKACDRPSVVPNDNVWVKTDVLMTHDVCGPGTIGNFYKEFGPKAKVREFLTVCSWQLIFCFLLPYCAIASYHWYVLSIHPTTAEHTNGVVFDMSMTKPRI